MKSILCFSGWGQNFKSLESCFRENILERFKISSVNYSMFEGFANLKKSLNNHPNPEIIVGWSLGGQISLRLIQDKIFNPKLIAKTS